MAVATNKEYFDAFNDYLQTNNIEQAVADGQILSGQQVYPVNFDMFVGFLIDKIVKQVVAQNAFIDKLDFLYKGTIPVGRVIEDVRTILKSKLYNYDTQDFEKDVPNPYKKHKKGLSVTYHSKIDRKKITLTISYKQLATGCLTEGGVDRIVNTMINDTMVEYSAWAYEQKKKALENKDFVSTRYFKDYADFNMALKGIKLDVTNYDNSYKHNKMALLTPMSERDLVIIMNERFKNFIDVTIFTGLFNVSYAELKDKIYYIDSFIDESIVCGIYDRRGLEFNKVLDVSKQLENGGDLTANRWLHFWRMHSTSPQYTAVVFKQANLLNASIVNDENIIVNGYNETDSTFITNYDYIAKFEGKYSLDNGKTWNDMSKGDTIAVTNNKSIAPVKLLMRYTPQGEPTYNVTIMIRFEYPSYVDATLGDNVDEV